MWEVFCGALIMTCGAYTGWRAREKVYRVERARAEETVVNIDWDTLKRNED